MEWLTAALVLLAVLMGLGSVARAPAPARVPVRLRRVSRVRR